MSYGDPQRRGTLNTVTIGKFCSIADGCIIDGGFNHQTKFVSTFPFNQRVEGLEYLTGHPVCKGDVEIGNDVWICEDVLIMSGVKIGDGSVIGAHSIVTKDVEPYSIVAGLPAKEIKKRFNNEQIKHLLNIRWWDWSIEKIKDNGHLLMSKDIDSFIRVHING